MKQFITNAAPVLKKISHNDETANILKNQTWVLVDGKNDDEKYLFLESGEVMIDREHNKTNVRWEFSDTTHKLLIYKAHLT